MDSRSSTAIVASSNATITATSIQVVGGYSSSGNAKFTPTDKCKYFDTSHGSTVECAACLDLLFIKQVLTSGQIRLLPGGLRDMVMVPGFKGQFYYGGGP